MVFNELNVIVFLAEGAGTRPLTSILQSDFKAIGAVRILVENGRVEELFIGQVKALVHGGVLVP